MEIWKEIKDYEGYYWVSNLGRIKSKYRILKQSVDNYKFVTLCKNGIKKFKHVHRLVAEAFVPNPERKPQVNHKNENKLDNKALNLEWMTQQENLIYGTGRQRGIEGRFKRILQFDSNMNLIKEFESMVSVEKEGFSKACVCMCCKEQRKSHKGFIWKYGDRKL